MATGIARGQGRYPWHAHVRGLLGHLSLGLATHAALTSLETDFATRPISRHRGA